MNCGTCKWFHERPEYFPLYSGDTILKQGDCRRHAPICAYEQPYPPNSFRPRWTTHWPTVAEDLGCGEHEEKPNDDS